MEKFGNRHSIIIVLNLIGITYIMHKKSLHITFSCIEICNALYWINNLTLYEKVQIYNTSNNTTFYVFITSHVSIVGNRGQNFLARILA